MSNVEHTPSLDWKRNSSGNLYALLLDGGVLIIEPVADSYRLVHHEALQVRDTEDELKAYAKTWVGDDGA